MPTLATNVLTLLDWAKRLDPNGKTPVIAELLSQTNPVLDDMLWMEGNLPTGHRTTMRTGLPTVAWRLINNGVQPSKSTTTQVDEACGMLEAWSEVDKKLADLNGNTNEFRLSEGQAFIEAMNIEMASTLFYGNQSVSAEEFTGLSARYSSLSAANGQNIINCSGSDSDLSSVWLVGWGARSVHGIFPKGSKAGLQHNNMGEVTVETTAGIAGTRMRAYQDQWTWDCGLALRDWRYVSRAANIDISNLVTKTGAANLIDSMIKMIHAIGADRLAMTKACFYMNRSVFAALDIQQRDDVKAGGGLTYTDVNGKMLYSFRGVPVKVCDALLETEDAVS